MKRAESWIFLLALASCSMQVQLGGPNQSASLTSATGQVDLQVERTEVTVDLRGSADITQAPNGDLILRGEDTILVVHADGTTSRLVFERPGDSRGRDVEAITVMSGALVLGTRAGAFACALTGPDPSAPGPGPGPPPVACALLGGDGSAPSVYAPGSPVFGFAPLADGGTLFVTPDGVGELDPSADVMHRVSRYHAGSTAFTADGALFGTTRAPLWLRLDHAPYVCQLSRLPDGQADPINCAGSVLLQAPASQAVQAPDGRIAFGTFGRGALFFDGQASEAWGQEQGLPDGQVNDLIVWQGTLWAATENGLGRYEAATKTTALPAAAAAGDLANAPVVALALAADGSLVALAGRQPSRLYRLRRSD